jgi:hypothetical protein
VELIGEALMSALPERYQCYAHQGQPEVRHGEVELCGERDPIVHTTDAYGQPVQMRRSQLPVYERTPPRDLTPQPLIDPLAQRMAAGDLLGAGVGWGGAQLVNAIAGGMVGLVVFALLLLAARSGRRGGDVINITNNNRGFGRSHTSA